MALPATLSQGIISIYGGGSDFGVSGISVLNSGFYFGMVDQVSIYSSFSIYDNILFSEDAIKARLLFVDYPYTLLDETKVILIEQAL
jgi:hypothetical protein